MGYFSVRSVLAGLGRGMASAAKIWPLYAALVGIGGFSAYNGVAKRSAHFSNQRELYRSSPPAVVMSDDGMTQAGDRFVGDYRDVFVKAKDGVERILGLPDSDEKVAWLSGDALVFESDKDAAMKGFGRYDSYAWKPDGSVERMTFNNAGGWCSAGMWTNIVGWSLGGTALLYGALVVFGAAMDRRRLRQGKTPRNLHVALKSGFYIEYGTEEGRAKGREMKSKICPTPFLAMPSFNDLDALTPGAQRQCLDAFSYLGEDHLKTVVPLYSRFSWRQEKKGQFAHIEKGLATEDARLIHRALLHTSHDEYAAGAACMEQLFTRRGDVFSCLLAAEYYNSVLRVTPKDVSPEAARERCAYYLQKGLRQVLSAEKMTSFSGSKNKVVFLEDIVAGDIMVIKVGGAELGQEYGKLSFLHKVLPAGMVPFPVAFTTGVDGMAGLDRSDHLLVSRRLPGTMLAESKNVEDFTNFGNALGVFHQRATLASQAAGQLKEAAFGEDLVRRTARLEGESGVSLSSDMAYLAARADWGPKGVVHGDCTGVNTIFQQHPVSGRVFSFVDVEAVGIGRQVHDLGSFFAHFSCNAPPAPILDAYRSSLPLFSRPSRDELAERVYCSALCNWVSKVSTEYSWFKAGKFERGLSVERLGKCARRLKVLLGDAVFSSAAKGSSFDSLSGVEEHLLRI